MIIDAWHLKCFFMDVNNSASTSELHSGTCQLDRY
jgi:hypothetical protein